LRQSTGGVEGEDAAITGEEGEVVDLMGIGVKFEVISSGMALSLSALRKGRQSET